MEENKSISKIINNDMGRTENQYESYKIINKYNLCINQSWKTYNNMFVPTIKLITNENKFLALWSDEIILRLSEDQYCVECAVKTTSSLCLSCQQSDNQKMFNCILEQAGKPFGKECIKSDPPCGNENFADKICFTEYIVYIGKKGESWKIGISRSRRDNIDSGYLLRLIEQGIEEAIIIRTKKRLTLPEAQKLEGKISEELGIRQVLNKELKRFSLKELENEINQMYDNTQTEILPGLLRVGLFSPWLELFEAKKLFLENKLTVLKGGDILNGKILASWGKESLIKTTEGVKKINRNHLLGKKLLPPDLW